jgi:hypothetical protein
MLCHFFVAMAFSPYVEGILMYIQTTTADEDASPDYLKTCYNLLGDLASTYQTALKPALLEPSISRVLSEAKNRGFKQRGVVNAAKYARQASLDHGSIDASKTNTICLVEIGGQSSHGLKSRSFLIPQRLLRSRIQPPSFSQHFALLLNTAFPAPISNPLDLTWSDYHRPILIM